MERGTKVFEMSRVERVLQGVGARHSLADEVRRLGRSRVMVVTGKSLGAEPIFEELTSSLGSVVVGVFKSVQAHNPIQVLGDLVEQSRVVDADVFVGIGGGSPIDAAKLAALGVVEGVTDPKDFVEYAVQFEYPDKEYVKPLKGRPAPVIALPTTLSAAEWDGFAGSVDMERGVKDVARYLELTPTVVIQDPELCAVTPRDLWASTGMRAVDHAVETIYAKNAHPFTTSLSIGALELLGKNLPRSFDDAADLDATMACQTAEWMSIVGVHNVSLGLSHAIGHQLGALGVPHGVTSCIMLPQVMRFLAPATAEQQRIIARALDPEAAASGLSAPDIVEALLDRLSVPRCVSDFGVSRDKMALVAEATLGDVIARESPVPINQNVVIDLLEEVW